MTGDRVGPDGSGGGSGDGEAGRRSGRFAPKPDPVQMPVHSSRIGNLPNLLTIFRLVLVIPFVVLLFGHGQETPARIWATVIFVLAATTDFFDGELARRHNVVTNFGKIADPIADKALTGSALIGLSVLGELPWWVTVVILAREVGVTVMRFLVIKDGVIAASRGGKAKTVLQLLAILLYLLPVVGFLASARVWVMGLALLLTVLTGIDYAFRAIRLHRAGSARGRANRGTGAAGGGHDARGGAG